MSATQASRANADDRGQVDFDLDCAACGYNLRSRSRCGWSLCDCAWAACRIQRRQRERTAARGLDAPWKPFRTAARRHGA